MWTGTQIASIVVAALLFYNVYRGLGYEEKLRVSFGREYSGRVKLPLAVFFTGFIESVSGFGITVAVTAPMLVMLGINPLVALVACLIGHSWAVPFAAIGIPTLVLSSLASADPFRLSQITGVLMFPPLVLTLVFVGKILKVDRRSLFISVTLALLLSLVACLVGPMTGVAASLLMFLAYIVITLREKINAIIRSLELYISLSTILILAYVLGIRGLVPTSTIIILLAVFSSVYRDKSILQPIIKKTVAASYKPVVAIILFTMVADISRQTGIMEALAREIALVSGSYFVYLIPIVGIIGTYVTGSNTASNIIFAALHESYAKITGLDLYLILALQNSGGGLGSMISPPKIAVGASTLEARGLEGTALRNTLKYIIPISTPLLAIATLALTT